MKQNAMLKTITLVMLTALILTGCKTTGSAFGGLSGNGSSSGDQTQGLGSPDQFGSAGGIDSLSSEEKSQVASMDKKVYFAFDSYALSAQGKQVAEANASFLLKHPSVSVMLAGHTDPRGSQEYNFHLGERRASAVKDFLMQQGVAANQLCTVSYGELKPAASPTEMSADKAYQADRRVEIQYGEGCQTGEDAPAAGSGSDSDQNQ